jgi:hypothetical protein
MQIKPSTNKDRHIPGMACTLPNRPLHRLNSNTHLRTPRRRLRVEYTSPSMNQAGPRLWRGSGKR